MSQPHISLSQAVLSSGHIENCIAGESIVAPAWVYISSADGKMYKANATTTTNPAVGIVFASVTNGNTGQIAFSGIYEWPSATFTPGQEQYLSASTSGAMTTTAPTNKQSLGYSVSSGRFKVDPQPYQASFALGYKIYVANITQSGTSAPSATILENTLGVTPTWARAGIGQYTLTATGAWVTNKTALPDSRVFIGGEDSDEVSASIWVRTSADVLTMRIVKPSSALEQNIEMLQSGQDFTVTIKVYN